MFPSTTKEAAEATKKMAEDDVKRSARRTVEGARDDMSGYADMVGHEMDDFVDATCDMATESTKYVQQHIEDHPIRSSMIALGVGFVLGIMLRR